MAVLQSTWPTWPDPKRQTVAEVFVEAKRLSDPLHSDGNHVCTLFVLRRTAEEIVVRCGPGAAQVVRDRLKPVLVEASAQEAAGQTAEAVRTLQQAMTELCSRAGATRQVQLDGMPQPSALFAEGYPELARAEDYPRGSAAIKLSTLRGTIAMLIKLSKATLNENPSGALFILTRSVQDIVLHMDAQHTAELSVLHEIRDQGEMLASGEGHSSIGAKAIIKRLRALACHENNPSLAAGMSNPMQFAMDANFPDVEGDETTRAGGCCVLS